MAYEATRKIITAVPQFTETLLAEFMSFMSIVAEKLQMSRTRYTLVLSFGALLSCIL